MTGRMVAKSGRTPIYQSEDLGDREEVMKAQCEIEQAISRSYRKFWLKFLMM